MKNYAVNVNIKNIHIRFEDDQLINFIGDISLGFKIEKIHINLSSEGILKKDYFQLEKMDVYWESKAKILIPSTILLTSLNNLNELDAKLIYVNTENGEEINDLCYEVGTGKDKRLYLKYFTKQQRETIQQEQQEDKKDL